MSGIPRRRLLAATGVGLAGAIAGCSSSDDADEPDDETEADPEDGETESSTEVEGTVLGDITIDNLNDTSHSVDIVVEFDREIEDWKTEDLEPDSGTTLERNWPSDPGEFRVTARLDQNELRQITPGERDPDCLNLFVRIDRDGELAFLTNTDGGPCGSGDAAIDDAETE